MPQNQAGVTSVAAAETEAGGHAKEPSEGQSNQLISKTPANDLSEGGVSNFVVVIQALVWPLTILLALMLIAHNDRLGRILGIGTKLVKKVSAGGVQIEINAETVQLVQRQLHGTFQELIESSTEEYERMADIQEIPTHLKNAIVENGLKNVSDLRATVHVNDVIFPEYLYQLVDYYPRGGGGHRRNSQRYGIIGRSWRSSESHGTGDAFAGIGSVEALVENWGMTHEEAQGQVSARPSSMSIVVRHEEIPVGILFVDSTSTDAFGNDTQATERANEIAVSPSVKRLGEALARTLAPLRTAAPSIKIIGS
ncbi:hypothetical protein CEW89_05815 [Celeribacter ethanolicus]|uniref:GAF domain-containing protein n=1 Tax=Celeribacter ethanolicus TaxID=1758178 RepID=A0A291GAA9_9RHOB|nr:hypothetical protein CEW89_05815 [Celeribacter ethanolicus]